jgi:hypothetical protein|tara:strand:- start:22 stop:234 length:213 start_codon:yes stop_codon:yes gene_type:complete
MAHTEAHNDALSQSSPFAIAMELAETLRQIQVEVTAIKKSAEAQEEQTRQEHEALGEVLRHLEGAMKLPE